MKPECVVPYWLRNAVRGAAGTVVDGDHVAYCKYEFLFSLSFACNNSKYVVILLERYTKAFTIGFRNFLTTTVVSQFLLLKLNLLVYTFLLEILQLKLLVAFFILNIKALQLCNLRLKL